MTIRSLTAGTVLSLALLAGACANPQTEPQGRALAEVKARQIENPGAGEIPAPVEGQGAITNGDVLQNYHRGQDLTVQEQQDQRRRRRTLTGTGTR